jgi:hypothetical protein
MKVQANELSHRKADFGQWPGDETDEEIDAELRKLS